MTKQEVMTNKTDAELSKLLSDSRAELRVQRFSAVGARAKDSNSSKKLRATIARVLTEKHSRSLRGTVEAKVETK